MDELDMRFLLAIQSSTQWAMTMAAMGVCEQIVRNECTATEIRLRAEHQQRMWDQQMAIYRAASSASEGSK